MDEIRAKRMANELIGKYIGQWKIVRYINCGKSALVLQGEHAGQNGAIKVFDPEMIERFGKAIQLQRIQRELSVRDKHHENMVHIFDGGECAQTGYLFVAMEYLSVPNLEEVIKTFPRNEIRMILSQIASAAQYLESLGLCHRDIKPSNIAITEDYQKATLLDLGVLRPIGNSDLTDDEARHFIGTLRYSSPEFLMRTELDTTEGWRAVTFYQLGATLYDLIMQKPLFEEYSEPFAQLVEAVKVVNPIIKADDISPDLILLTQKCLIKDPELRLKLVSWESFSLNTESSSVAEAAKQRVHQRKIMGHSNIFNSSHVKERESRYREKIQKQLLENIENIIRRECAGNQSFPPITIVDSVGNSPDSIQLEVTFQPSSAHNLNLSLHLIFTIVLLDAATETISLYYGSAVSKSGVNLTQFPEDRYYNLFDGPYNLEIIMERMGSLLYLSFDTAQQLSMEADEEFMPIGPFEGIGG